MVIEKLKTHWKICQKVRHGTDEEKRIAFGYLKAAKLFVTDPVVDKALRNVETSQKKHAAL